MTMYIWDEALSLWWPAPGSSVPMVALQRPLGVKEPPNVSAIVLLVVQQALVALL